MVSPRRRAEGWLAVLPTTRWWKCGSDRLGHQYLAGMYRAIAALAGAGLDVIVDDVIDDERVLRLSAHLCRRSRSSL